MDILDHHNIGAVPFNLIYVQAGMKLNELDNLKVIDTPMIVTMVCLAILALIPTLMKDSPFKLHEVLVPTLLDDSPEKINELKKDK